jgi:myo-inositol catabolism protein IolC
MSKLYILPFDHRGSFIKMFGYDARKITPQITAELADYKHIIYEAFLKSLEAGVPKDSAAILVDEGFGTKILEEAKVAGITKILTTEKSGQDEYDFEYGEKFGDHIDKFKPEYVKVLVRYNPEFEKQMNRRQLERLKTLNDFCKNNNYKFLFELLAIPTHDQKSTGNYDTEERWQVMCDSIKEIQVAGIEPDIWKLEGLESKAQMESVVEVARANGREHVGIVVLGRGESDEKVRLWLSAGADIKGVIGFAVGRTVFKQALLDHKDKKLTREETAEKIAENFKEFIDIFEEARSKEQH